MTRAAQKNPTPQHPTKQQDAEVLAPPRPSPGGGDPVAHHDGATPAIRVTSAREGFRRGGRPWSVTPTDVPVAEFTPEQLAQLRAEPLLTVEDLA